jgi:hypothetical protein
MELAKFRFGVRKQFNRKTDMFGDWEWLKEAQHIYKKAFITKRSS